MIHEALELCILYALQLGAGGGMYAPCEVRVFVIRTQILHVYGFDSINNLCSRHEIP